MLHDPSIYLLAAAELESAEKTISWLLLTHACHPQTQDTHRE